MHLHGHFTAIFQINLVECPPDVAKETIETSRPD